MTMCLPRFFSISILAVISFVSHSCAPYSQPQPPPAPVVSRPPLFQWDDDGGPGKVAVKIDLSEQKAHFTRGGRPIGWSFVATGEEGFRTPTGTFSITEKVVDKRSNRYGRFIDEFGTVLDSDARYNETPPPGSKWVGAPMPYWMRLTDYGIGMHAGPIPNPGSPASHGCIRLPNGLAHQLHEAVRIGTPVTISP